MRRDGFLGNAGWFREKRQQTVVRRRLDSGESLSKARGAGVGGKAG